MNMVLPTILLRDHCCTIARLPSGLYYSEILMPYGNHSTQWFASIDHCLDCVTMLVGRRSYRELIAKDR